MLRSICYLEPFADSFPATSSKLQLPKISMSKRETRNKSHAGSKKVTQILCMKVESQFIQVSQSN